MAGRIAQSFIDDLLTRIDIVDVISARVPLRESGSNHKGLCPFHDEKTPSFTVSRDKQFYHCFGCGAHGTAISFLMDYDNIGFLDAINDLASAAGMQVPNAGDAPSNPQDPAIYRVLDKATRYFATQLRSHSAAHRATQYLKQRGLSGEIAARYELGFAPPGWRNLLTALEAEGEPINSLVEAGLVIDKDGRHYDRFRDRIMFPIRDSRGRVIGFGGRVMGDEEPKYLNSPETTVFKKGHELYGVDRAHKKHKKLSRVFVVEGYMDVLALAQFGIDNTVATLGTATTREHLTRLFRLAPEVVFCFDGDTAGQQAAWRALQTAVPLLREGRSVGFLFLPEGEDPDSLVRSRGCAFFQKPKHVTPISQFLLDTLMDQVDAQTIEGRARLVELAKPLVSKVPPGAFRELLNQEIARLSRLEPARLASLVKTSEKQPIKGSTNTGRAAKSPSLVRTAIMLLLHEPSLAMRVKDPVRLAALELPGIPLLVEIFKIIHETPNIATGAIIERFRDTPEGLHLSKLMLRPLLIPAEGIEREFRGAIERLQQLTKKQRRNSLLKLSAGELNDEDKSELHQLLSFSNVGSSQGRF